MSKGSLIVWSGPSGSGKGTVLAEARKRDENLKVSVSATTRKPRTGDIDGVHYHFITKEDFLSRMERGEFLEYASYVGNYYGTLEKTVDEMLEAGHDVILEIEVVGAMKVKKKRPDALLVFVKPPSMEELRRRLSGRGTESADEIERRIAEAERELSCAKDYDYVIINDDAGRAADELIKIIKEHKKA
ncbi:MAG: guanylate kinase [Clostridia bacterium]|nr:guanylate kinase [Clostridia bacterium]MBQ4249747.1 guanylate kinase [Clostridia bacterium]